MCTFLIIGQIFVKIPNLACFIYNCIANWFLLNCYTVYGQLCLVCVLCVCDNVIAVCM